MRSFTQLLEGWTTLDSESLMKNIRTAEDVDRLFSKLEAMADQDGYINLNGAKTTVQKMREYVGTLRRFDVIKANGLYAAR